MDSLNEKGVTGDDGNAQETGKANSHRVIDEAAAVKRKAEKKPTRRQLENQILELKLKLIKVMSKVDSELMHAQIAAANATVAQWNFIANGGAPVENVYRELAKKYHPDTGPDKTFTGSEVMADLNRLHTEAVAAICKKGTDTERHEVRR